jgi:nucleoporin NUP2
VPPINATSFSTPSSAFSFTSSTFTPSNPVAAAAAPISNATQVFASIVNASSRPETTKQNGYPTDSADDERVKVETVYYTALRGLNVAFLAACKKAVETDPYVNIADFLERYNTSRTGAKSEYDANIKKISTSAVKAELAPAASTSTPLNGFGGSSVATSATSATPAEPKNTFAMPSAPSGFAGFTFGSGTSTNPSHEGGSKPPSIPIASSGKPFAFGSSAADKSDKGTDGGSAPAPVKSAFSFGPTTSGTTFTFGEKAATASTTAGIGSAPSVFSSSLFGATQPSGDTQDKESEKPKDTAAATSIFGNPASSSALPSSSTSTPFAFGTSASSAPKSGSFFSFGKTGSGSLGNPVGFGFGSPPRTPDAASVQPSTTSGFAFGAPKVSVATDGEAGTSETADDAPPPLVTNTVHDQDGEGEEDETTAYEQKCKVFKMAKMDSGTQEWKDLGVG